MPTVTINGTSYEVYANVATADLYLQADLSLFQTWDGASEKEIALVSATRYLDRQRWQGTKTSDVQPLAWPRTGVIDRYGNSIASASVPQAIIDACCLLAATFVTDPSLMTKLDQSSNIAEVQAGTARVRYFKPQSVSAGTATKLPSVVQDLIGQFLAVSFSAVSGAFGTDGESSFCDGDQFGQTSGGNA